MFFPCVVMGVALKSNALKICAYANNLKFVIDFFNKFIVTFACFNIQYHKYIGKLLSTDANSTTNISLMCVYHVPPHFSCGYVVVLIVPLLLFF